MELSFANTRGNRAGLRQARYKPNGLGRELARRIWQEGREAYHENLSLIAHTASGIGGGTDSGHVVWWSVHQRELRSAGPSRVCAATVPCAGLDLDPRLLGLR